MCKCDNIYWDIKWVWHFTESLRIYSVTYYIRCGIADGGLTVISTPYYSSTLARPSVSARRLANLHSVRHYYYYYYSV